MTSCRALAQGGIRHLALIFCPAHVDVVLETKIQVREHPCRWSLSHDMDKTLWYGECGVTWLFFDGGPEEIEMKYCPQCGHPVMVVHRSEA